MTVAPLQRPATPDAGTDARVRVFSLQTTMLGNRTYGELLRAGLESSQRVRFDSHWCPEPVTLRARGLRAFFGRGAPSRWVRERNLDLFKARFELGTSYVARAALLAGLSQAAPDVVHIHTQSLALLAGDVASRIPTVVSADMNARQSALQEVPAGYRWTYELNYWLERRVLRNAAGVVTLSDWAARAMIADYDLAPERVHAIPPGTNIAAFDAIEAARRERRRDGPLSLLFVGGEFERKGGDLLARTFIDRFAGHDIQLNVVTRATDVPRHEKIIVHRDVTPFSPAWCRLYAEADVFVLPTRRDASPHVFVEAMAAGVPAIGTAVGSIAEAIVDGETGFVIPPNDERALANAIERLTSEPALRERFGQAGRRRAEQQYDATQNLKRLEGVFVAAAGRR